jgi:hypothetical protein
MIPYNLDGKTTALLSDLQTDFDITFETKDIDYCEVFQKGKNATIYYNPTIINTESIAHELLHIWLKRFTYSMGNRIYLATRYDKKLSKFLDKVLCDYISNCCDHYKMYPKYLEMGYSPKEFLKNGLALKTSISDIKKLKFSFLIFYNSCSINHFISYLLSILADHIKENDYTEHHKLLIKEDLKLYNIICDFWTKWQAFDIENIDPIYNSDLELTGNFVKELISWSENKIII